LLHLLDVDVSVLGRHAPEVLANFNHQVPDIFGHHLGVAADVQVSSLLADQLPESLGVLPHSVGDVDFLGPVSRERGVKGEDAVVGELLQLVLVDVVLVLVSAAEEEVGLADGLALLFLPEAFLLSAL
jgi:hypothetical protein